MSSQNLQSPIDQARPADHQGGAAAASQPVAIADESDQVSPIKQADLSSSQHDANMFDGGSACSYLDEEHLRSVPAEMLET